MRLIYRILTTIAVIVIGVIAVTVDSTVALLTSLKSGVTALVRAIQETWA
jgi:hypothetical protein